MAYKGTINNAPGVAPPGTIGAAAHDQNAKTVAQFLQTPSPTVLPFDAAGIPALPLPQHMVAGMPYPHSAQTRLAIWNRAGGGKALPVGVSYNAPRNRMTQQ